MVESKSKQNKTKQNKNKLVDTENGMVATPRESDGDTGEMGDVANCMVIKGNQTFSGNHFGARTDAEF